MDMHWEKAEEAVIDPDAYYVVQDNGGEWRDFDLCVIRGLMVERRLRPEHVRGRPQWVAKITNPTSV